MIEQLVSIIVPIYKVEPYLERCVRSITSQTYRNIEVILVDDGSPDNSGKLADSLASEDNRLVVIHKENGGLSSARNVGVENAHGDYVMFVDSDDFWMDGECLMRLVKEIELTQDCDVLGFNCNYYYESDGKESYTPWIPYNDSLVSETDKEQLIVKLVKTGVFPMSACLKIIKRDFLIDNAISFKEGITGEDIPWFLEVLRKAKGVRMLNDYIYAYRQTSPDSITHSFSMKNFNNLFDTVKSEIPLLEHAAYKQSTKDALLSFLAYEWCILLGGVNKIEDKTIRWEARKELKEYQWLLKYTANPKVAKVDLLHKLTGIRFTEFALRSYLANRK